MLWCARSLHRSPAALETALSHVPDTPCGAATAGSLRILLVCAEQSRERELRLALALAGPATAALQLVWTRDASDAWSQAIASPPDLVVVDMQLDLAASRALVQRLARWLPALEVLRMADDPLRAAGGHQQVWAWTALPQLLGGLKVPR